MVHMSSSTVWIIMAATGVEISIRKLEMKLEGPAYGTVVESVNMR